MIRKMLPAVPIITSWVSADSNIAVNKLQTSTNVISLAETPAMKAKPPLWPLLRLCLITEKITGPTDMLNSKPNANPFANAAIIRR